jgi:hypothetical protein
MKSLRTIEVNAPDSSVFKKKSSGELVVSRAFDATTLQGISRAPICSDFLGTKTLGWSMLVQIVDGDENKRAQTVEVFARLTDRSGALDLNTARAAAEEGSTFASSPCDQVKARAIALSRSIEDGSIRDALRILLTPRGPNPLYAHEFIQGKDNGRAQQIEPAILARGVRK